MREQALLWSINARLGAIVRGESGDPGLDVTRPTERWMSETASIALAESRLEQKRDESLAGLFGGEYRR